MNTTAKNQTSTDARARRGKRQALLILAIAAAPIVLGTIAFQQWEGGRTTNYGELLKPVPTEVAGQTADGQPWRLSDSRGKWRLIIIDPGECDDACRTKLLYTRQVRLALGRDQPRVHRIWMTSAAAAPNEEVRALLHEGERVIAPAIPDAFGGAEAPQHIFLVDPLGNLMMRYPAQPEPKGMIRDLQRLLKYSGSG